MTPTQLFVPLRLGFLAVRGVLAFATDKEVRKKVGMAALGAGALMIEAVHARLTREHLAIDPTRYPYMARYARTKEYALYWYKERGFTLDKHTYFATMDALEKSCARRWWASVVKTVLLVAVIVAVIVCAVLAG